MDQRISDLVSLKGLFFTVLGILFVTGCGSGLRENFETNLANKDAVQGGQNAKVNQFPYLVKIHSGSFHWCGGSLISSKWVLTAGHCLEGPGKLIDVYIGAHTFDGPTKFFHREGRRLEVEAIYFHPQYTRNAANLALNDVALIKLAQPVLDVAPLALAGSGFKIRNYQRATIAGWGAISENVFPSALQVGEVSLYQTDKCDRYARRNHHMTVTPDMICGVPSSENWEGGCGGDSGGPVVVWIRGRPVQVGITSWGSGCKKSWPRLPLSGFSYVPWSFAWIQAMIKQ